MFVEHGRLQRVGADTAGRPADEKQADRVVPEDGGRQ